MFKPKIIFYFYVSLNTCSTGHPNRERSPNRGGGGGDYRSGRNNSEFTNARGEMPNRYHQGGGGGGGGGGHTGVSHGNRREGGMDPDQDYKVRLIH